MVLNHDRIANGKTDWESMVSEEIQMNEFKKNLRELLTQCTKCHTNISSGLGIKCDN